MGDLVATVTVLYIVHKHVRYQLTTHIPK